MGLCGTEFGTHKDALSAVFFVQENPLYQNERAKAETCVFSCEEWYPTSPVIGREVFSGSRWSWCRNAQLDIILRENLHWSSLPGPCPQSSGNPRAGRGVRGMEDTRRVRYPVSRADLHLISTQLAAQSGGHLFWGEFYSKDGVSARGGSAAYIVLSPNLN